MKTIEFGKKYIYLCENCNFLTDSHYYSLNHNCQKKSDAEIKSARFFRGEK